jgi:hypothetical protein
MGSVLVMFVCPQAMPVPVGMMHIASLESHQSLTWLRHQVDRLVPVLEELRDR